MISRIEFVLDSAEPLDGEASPSFGPDEAVVVLVLPFNAEELGRAAREKMTETERRRD